MAQREVRFERIGEAVAQESADLLVLDLGTRRVAGAGVLVGIDQRDDRPRHAGIFLLFEMVVATAYDEARGRRDVPRQRREESVALAVNEIDVAVGLFGHAIEPKRNGLAERHVDIGIDAQCSEAAGAETNGSAELRTRIA